MWTLLFLISLLLGMKDRKKMWILGVAFITASGFTYFLFMVAWLNFFLFIGFIFWVRMAIAFVALAAAVFSLREYFVNKEGGCKATNTQQKRRFFEKLKDIIHRRKLLFSLAGIIALAFAVNLVELICSAGLPAIYTEILSLNHLAPWQHYLYIFFYILLYMADDIIVFLIAMMSFKMVGIEHKYARFSRLFGGLIMLIISFLLFFKPNWLMFN